MRAFAIAIVLAAATSSAWADIVIGNGKVETERRTVPAFSSISVGGSGTLKVHRGERRLSITGDSNILPYVTTEVSGSELKIGFKPMTSISRMTKLEFEVTLPELEGVEISGSGEAVVDAFDGDEFKGRLSGSGSMKAALDYEKAALSSSGSGGFVLEGDFGSLDLRLSGSGEAYLVGSSDELILVISGSGRIGAKDFEAGEADITISGSGDIEIRASEALEARLSGSGELRYWGDPRVEQRVSGSGRVTRRGK